MQPTGNNRFLNRTLEKIMGLRMSLHINDNIGTNWDNLVFGVLSHIR
jgi:hypothetical protein